MEDISISSLASSTSPLESDAYNTESARLYFGPLKTPERKFIDNSNRLFPPSPILSSPRSRSPSQLIDDNEDMDLVVQLVNEPDEDEEDSATPQAGDGVEDGLLQLQRHICYFNDACLLRTIIRIGRQSYARRG